MQALLDVGKYLFELFRERGWEGFERARRRMGEREETSVEREVNMAFCSKIFLFNLLEHL